MVNEAERKAVTLKKLPIVESLNTNIVECFVFL